MREAFKFIRRNIGSSNLIGAEIGVREGKNVLSIIESSFINKLYLIDHYQPHIESSGVEVTFEQQQEFYSKMFNNLRLYLDKLVFLSVSSQFASTLFEDNFFDFVYIDAGHTYEQVQQDMKFWFPKVRSKGILCGHDFGNKCTPEVSKAVKDFCALRNLPVCHLGDLDWATQKI